MEYKTKPGKVYLVGAGPGDPGLFTIKGKECLIEADVVIYDHLVSPAIVKLSSPESEKIYAGKMASAHHLSQDEINQLLLDKAQQGKVIARLKGGDPFIFGRGGEEAMFLQQHGIHFEVVPGITAGYAAPAYAGIPLTHRFAASDLHFITGHEDPSKKESMINWKAVAGLGGTLVFFMGIKRIAEICKRLIDKGKNPGTPAAVIQWGTLPGQKTVTGTLDTITEITSRNGIEPPALIVIGEVVRLRERLSWFEKKPLFGKKIIVTRSRNQSSLLAKLLETYGADVIEFPTIRISPVTDFSEVDKTIKNVKEYNWIIFTSVNAVDIFFKRLFLLGMDVRDLSHNSFAAIGSSTRGKLKEWGVLPDLVPDTFTSEGALSVFKRMETDFGRLKILCPGSDIARDVISGELKKMDARVDSLVLYTTSICDHEESRITAIRESQADLVTFTSPSTVMNFSRICRENSSMNFLKQINGAAIGPVTAEMMRQENIRLTVTAKEHTVHGLVQAITDFFNPGGAE